MMPETRAGSHPAVAIRRWDEIADKEQLSAALDAIFFEASGTKSFASNEARAAFRERWLSRYFIQHPRWAYLALTSSGTLVGYLVGAINEATGFEDFAGVAQQFPAHLHVNLAPHYRSRGIGAQLIEAFAVDAARAGAIGMHVVTSVDARNVLFYERIGFSERARTTVNGRELAFLGRVLHADGADPLGP